MPKRRSRRPAVQPAPHYSPPPDKAAIEAKLAARLAEMEALSPEERDARFLEQVTLAVTRGDHVPERIMAAARDLGWTSPGTGTLCALATGRIGGAGWTPEWQRAFLLHLAENGIVTHACRHVGLTTKSVHGLRNRHPHSVFAILWDVAIRIARRRLLDEVTERALHGREEAVWYRGEQVGTRRVFNDRLLMFALSHEPPPAHPNLSQRELEQLWASLLPEVDALLPPDPAIARIADLSERSEDE